MNWWFGYSPDQTRASCREGERLHVWPDWTVCRGPEEMAAGGRERERERERDGLISGLSEG